jgi:hypothetical protein
MTSANVAANSDRFEARPKTIGDAHPRTDPSLSARNPDGFRTSTDGRTRYTDSDCRRFPLVLGTSCTENPMLDRNARLVPIDY